MNILGSKIYVFGGQVEGSFYNDLVAFDLNALQNPANHWEFLIPNTGDQINPNVPAARTNHTIISYNDQLYLFGGTNGVQWFNDVWTYDPKVNRWSQLDCIGYIPAPREGHAAALVNDVMYIFGGRTEDGNDLGDLAAFRISLRRWYTFQNMGPSPSPRSGHSMTAHGKQIIVVAGEPSTAPRDPAELSLAYILDTAKIRYPNDAPTMSQTQKALNGPPSPIRRPSSEAKQAARSGSRQGSSLTDAAIPPSVNRDVLSGGPVQRVDQPVVGPGPGPGPGPQPRAVRASISQTSAGPPPQSQAPNPRTNGVPVSQTKIPGPAPPTEGIRVPPQEVAANPTVQETQRQVMRPSRDGSPSSSSHGRQTPTSQSMSKAKAMEAGEAAPLMGAGVARQRSLRSQRGHSSIDSSEAGVLGRTGSGKARTETPTERNSKSFADEPKSPKITPHQEALMKELEAVKNRNAWYASELALAKKAGFGGSSSPTLDEQTTTQFSDDDKPLVEAFMAMRGELMRMQQSMEQQASLTAKKIAEVEHQRDAAITEAAYARAKLAAHGGSQRSTPQLDGHRISEESERSTEISRRLALALAATNEHKAKIENLNEQLGAEKRARELAEETAEAAQRRIVELGQTRNTGELEALKADLHEAQSAARAEAGSRAEAEQRLRMLEVDHTELTEKHRNISGQMSEHVTSLTALEAAVAASQAKASTYEQQLGEEREQREVTERKLMQLRAEHGERLAELESTGKRLRDTQQLADGHAKEAATHREALVAGLSKLSNPDRTTSRDSLQERRLAALQHSADQASALAKVNQEAAESAAQKLRGAEERIAGLEAYQEQTSREGLQIRRQLQTALRDVANHQAQNRQLAAQIETHQRDASALAVQHGALKDLLGERGIDVVSSRRSPRSDTPGSPADSRLRDLEQQLQSSMKSHEETKNMFESREQEAERAYRERLEQLENDYQSLLTYVKGTEKMLKKMKEELTKYKTQNQKLQMDLEKSRQTLKSTDETQHDAAAWATEREALQTSINELKSSMTRQIQHLEANMGVVQRDLATAQTERDQQKASHDQMTRSIAQKESELNQLKSENSMLETRALDAEHRVTMLLDQVGSSISNIRRQSQMPPSHSAHSSQANGASIGHNRDPSQSTVTDTSEHDDDVDARGSLALDHLASELETLRTQWENTSRSYRLSDRFEFERTPTQETGGAGGELSDNMASWRRGFDDEEPNTHHSSVAEAAARAAARGT